MRSVSCLLLLTLVLAACSDEGLTRNFSVSRDSAPETIAATQMPLSAPPLLAQRPIRPGALAPKNPGNGQAVDEAAGSAGQEAFLEAAGPAPPPGVRRAIDENSGLIYPPPGFTQQLMTWSAPPGQAPIINPAPKGGWFSRLF